MKELVDLHYRLLALPDVELPMGGLNFSRGIVEGPADELPADLRADIEHLQAALDEALPEDFDYFAFVGDAAEGPAFDLQHENQLAEDEENPYDPEVSLLKQLNGLDWDKHRQLARDHKAQMGEMVSLMDRLTQPLPSAKGLQRTFQEETKDFIKEKRRDATKIHVLYWEEADGLMEVEFADGPALRAALPGMIADGCGVVTVVAGGKPLPAERIDALKSEAQKLALEKTYRVFDEADHADSAPEILAPLEEAPSSPPQHPLA